VYQVTSGDGEKTSDWTVTITGGKTAANISLGAWVQVENTTFDSNSTIRSIAYGGGKFVAVGSGSKMAYSSDGINWTAVANTGFTKTDISDFLHSIQDIAYGNGKFVAVGYGNQIAYSADGINWTAVANTGFLPSFNVVEQTEIYCVTYGGGKFIAGGRCFARGAQEEQGAQMASSSDGINWTPVDASVFGFGLWPQGGINGPHYYDRVGTIAYGNNRFVAGGNGEHVAHSTDGINWTKVTFPLNSIIYVAYCNDKFFAGAGYERVYSADGATWTKTTDATGGTPRHITYANGKYVSVGASSHIYYSANGLDWTNTHAFDGKYGGSGNFQKIAYGGNKFVVVGYANNKPFIAYCIDEQK
jgi:hypothetical protein